MYPKQKGETFVYISFVLQYDVWLGEWRIMEDENYVSYQ